MSEPDGILVTGDRRMPFCIEQLEKAGHPPLLLHFYLTEAEATGAFANLRRASSRPLLWACSREGDGTWTYFLETPAGVEWWGEPLVGKPWVKRW